MRRINSAFVTVGMAMLATACGSPAISGPVSPVAPVASSVQPVTPPPTPALDPKAATAYIKVSTPDELRRVFLTLSQDEDVNEHFRKFFMEYAMREASGSGFVAIGQSGRGALVVTNRHVIEGIDKPQISFDGGVTNITAKIVYVDRDYDLAILELANPMPGLAISSDYREMQEVFALGYPGLNGGNANYQAAQGSISNRCLEDDALTNSGNKNCWIQHTASIDPGSSGGPLVNRAGQVVGVNAAFVQSRHNMFLAVPATAVKTAVDKAEDIRTNRSNEGWMKEQLKSACYKLVSELSSGNARATRVLPFLSNKIVAKKGMQTFARYDEEPEIARAFIDDPFTGMQLAIAIHLRLLFVSHQGRLDSEKCENVNPMDNLVGNNDVRISVGLHDASVELSWLFERGSWRLSDFGS